MNFLEVRHTQGLDFVGVELKGCCRQGWTRYLMLQEFKLNASKTKRHTIFQTRAGGRFAVVAKQWRDVI